MTAAGDERGALEVLAVAAPVRRLPRGRVVAATLGLALVVVLIGWLDIVTGPRLGMSLFYLVPIVLAAWRMGRTPAVSIALLAALSWFTADMVTQEARGLGISTWNGITRMGIFLSIGLLISRVRTDQARTEALLRQETVLASTDALTGLLNSRAFFEALRRAGESPRLSLVYVDVDRFKAINDTAGHQQGDALLRAIAQALQARCSAGDAAARLGGDEFALLLHDRAPGDVETLVEQVRADVERLGAAHPEAELSLSAGVVHWGGIADIDALMRQADAEMYASKRARRRAGDAGR